jgi:phosphohistidine phosphatase
MRLILLRHAKAEKAAPGMSDRDRGLVQRGHDDAARIGAYLAHHELQPDLALVSAARRTRETFESLAAGLPAPPVVDYDDRLYNAGAAAILAVIREAAPAARALIVIGHNPGLHEAARLLVANGEAAARERLNEAMPTAGLAIIDFTGNDWQTLHPRSGRLERFVTPRLLKSATD